MPPVRGRELKPLDIQTLEDVERMPPVRGRELKLTASLNGSRKQADAPCAGARIETTGKNPYALGTTMPPVRGRELKRP